MIIACSPLRISIGGGGTDLPSYYRRNGGDLMSSATRITKLEGTPVRRWPAASVGEPHRHVGMAEAEVAGAPPSEYRIPVIGAGGEFEFALDRRAARLRGRGVVGNMKRRRG